KAEGREVMDAEAGFIEAIRERSDDRGRWLIFADWLKEQGDPRGELIRLQVHLPELAAEEPGWELLLAREFELFHTLQRETMVLSPPHIVHILMKAAMPIEEATTATTIRRCWPGALAVLPAGGGDRPALRTLRTAVASGTGPHAGFHR